MKTFNWKDFMSYQIAVHFKTEKECNDFLRIAEKQGIVWRNGIPPTDENYFKHNKSDTCYEIGFGGCLTHSSFSYFNNRGDTILEWSDYMEFTKEDLKVGMLVEVKNCGKAMVMPAKESDNILIFYGGQFADMDVMFNKIVKVWDLPTVVSQVFEFDTQSRYLIYERPTTKEMTVEEISEALGYDVKIVKG